MYGDVPRRPSYGVYISQLITFDRLCIHVEDFNAHNICLTAELFKQGNRYHKLRKAFFQAPSPTLCRIKISFTSGLSEPEFYGDLVYKFKKIMGRTDFFLISFEK